MLPSSMQIDESCPQYVTDWNIHGFDLGSRTLLWVLSTKALILANRVLVSQLWCACTWSSGLTKNKGILILVYEHCWLFFFGLQSQLLVVLVCGYEVLHNLIAALYWSVLIQIDQGRSCYSLIRCIPCHWSLYIWGMWHVSRKNLFFTSFCGQIRSLF